MRPSQAGAPAVPAGQDIPATLLLGHGVPASDDSFRRLAGRLAAKLGHGVEPCLLDGPGEPLMTVAGQCAARGATRLVVLPLVLGPTGEAARRVDRALASVAAAWPCLRLHRGQPPSSDDVARILGDRAREAMSALSRGRSAPESTVVVIAGGGTNPAANAELARLSRLVYEAHRFGDVSYAFADLTAPSVGEVIRRWARLGARAVVVVPYSLFSGSTRRRLIAQARDAATASLVQVSVARPLYPHPALVWALVRRHLEALQDASSPSVEACGSIPYINPALLRVLRGAHTHDIGRLDGLEERMSAMLPPRYRGPSVTVNSAPMGAAPLKRGPDGTVAWDEMWQGFCELALAGGPSHRGTLLEAVPREEALADPARYAEVLKELERGIRLVTGLDVVDGPAGWIGVVCRSEEMAIWLMRAIVVENVMARREGAILYLPASPRFTLSGEIRNLVTAVAKTHHYWSQHVAAVPSAM